MPLVNTQNITAMTNKVPPESAGFHFRMYWMKHNESSHSPADKAWLATGIYLYFHVINSLTNFAAARNNRGGSITYTTALRLMGQAGNVTPEPPPRIPVMMRLERASATGPLPWWQDTLAINRHYRRLTRMIFTTLVTELLG